jgi:hypothetical protein
MQGDQQSDIDLLRSESDKFAFLVGWWVQGERQLSGKKRVKEFRENVLQPAEALHKTLNNQEFVKEFSAPWGGFVDFDRVKFEQELQAIIAAAERHVAAIEKHLGRGKAWNHDLKRLHVYMAACFCEYFNRSFEPSRLNSSGKEKRHMFQSAVELLAKPLFKNDRRGSGFSGAIREHVDGWNVAKRQQFAEMAAAVAK